MSFPRNFREFSASFLFGIMGGISVEFPRNFGKAGKMEKHSEQFRDIQNKCTAFVLLDIQNKCTAFVLLVVNVLHGVSSLMPWIWKPEHMALYFLR